MTKVLVNSTCAAPANPEPWRTEYRIDTQLVSTPPVQEIGAMRKSLICTSLGALALLLALDVNAKASINYSADQAASCPPIASTDVAEESTSAPEPATATTTPARPAQTPIKSGRSTRPKWKALLPGTIK